MQFKSTYYDNAVQEGAALILYKSIRSHWTRHGLKENEFHIIANGLAAYGLLNLRDRLKNNPTRKDEFCQTSRKGLSKYYRERAEELSDHTN